MNRRPPNYPPPVTPRDQRDAAAGVQRDAKLRYSPLARSRFPLDGHLGLVGLLAMSALLIFMDVSMVKEAGRLPRSTNPPLVVIITGNVGILSMIGWMIAVRVTNRRARRRLFDGCPSCGYDLRGSTSGTCPECGRSISN